MFLARDGNKNQADPRMITMREDPNLELGRLEDLEEDFGFGAYPNEYDMMTGKLVNAIQGEGLFDEQYVPGASHILPGKDIGY